MTFLTQAYVVGPPHVKSKTVVLSDGNPFGWQMAWLAHIVYLTRENKIIYDVATMI